MLEQDILHRDCSLVAHAGEDMAVSVQRYGYGGVAQELLNKLGVNTFQEKQRGACVPEVVEADVGRPAFFSNGTNERCLRLDGLIGVPPFVVKTRPWSLVKVSECFYQR
jgi:hypothetical protein